MEENRLHCLEQTVLQEELGRRGTNIHHRSVRGHTWASPKQQNVPRQHATEQDPCAPLLVSYSRPGTPIPAHDFILEKKRIGFTRRQAELYVLPEVFQQLLNAPAPPLSSARYPASPCPGVGGKGAGCPSERNAAARHGPPRPDPRRGDTTTALTEEEQQAAAPQTAGVHRPRVPVEKRGGRRRRREGARGGREAGGCGGAAGAVWVPAAPPRTFMGRAGEAERRSPVMKPRLGSGEVPGPGLLASCPAAPRGPGRAGPPPAGRGGRPPSFPPSVSPRAPAPRFGGARGRGETRPATLLPDPSGCCPATLGSPYFSKRYRK